MLSIPTVMTIRTGITMTIMKKDRMAASAAT